MPDQATVITLINRVILESTGREVDVQPDDRIIESGLLDSLSMVNLVMALQAEFDVTLDINDMDEANFGSPAALTELIVARQG